MCTVQLLLFADVTSRRADNISVDVLRRPGQGAIPRSICRRLFSDDRSPRPSDFLKSLEADLERQVQEKWNFDFRTGKPLPGRYQWVNADSVVAEVPQKITKSDTSCRTEKRPQLTGRSSQSTTQSKITDFLQQRKRQRTVDSDISPKLKSRRLMDYSAATSH